MSQLPTVLVVAQDTRLAATLVSWLRDSGCDFAVTTSFAGGKHHLDGRPSIVLAEVKLGAYNGLHLALRARAKGIPAVVFGETNAITERDAEHLGVAYLSSSQMQKHQLQELVRAAVTRSPDATAASSPMPASCENPGTGRGTGIFAGS